MDLLARELKDINALTSRILLIIPNYRPSPSLTPHVCLNPREKFGLAAEDPFDPGTFALAALFAGESEPMNSNLSFGHGPVGFGHYFVTLTSDIILGEFMPEGVFPIIL